MNAEERQALREKHTAKPAIWGDGKEKTYCDFCFQYLDDRFPPTTCDVIKVLDAWEEADD
jgi:hypothetical protein